MIADQRGLRLRHRHRRRFTRSVVACPRVVKGPAAAATRRTDGRTGGRTRAQQSRSRLLIARRRRRRRRADKFGIFGCETAAAACTAD